MRIFFLLFFLYALSHVYIFFGFLRAFGPGAWEIPAILWLLFGTFAWCLRITVRYRALFFKLQGLFFLWMGFAILLCYCMLAVDLTTLAVELLALHYASLKPAALALSSQTAMLACLGAAVFLFTRAFHAANAPVIRRIRIITPKLPPGSPALRIAALSDIHISALLGPAFLRRLNEHLEKEKSPHILLMAGDLVDKDPAALQEEADILRLMPVRSGGFAVTGNHEDYLGIAASLKFMQLCGLHALRGETAEAAGILLAGVDDIQFAGRTAPDTTNADAVLPPAGDGRFVLLMNHRPIIPARTVGRFDLQFSGHTHGGQIWPGRYVTRRLFGFRQGLTRVYPDGKREFLGRPETVEAVPGTSLLYLSDGTGFWGPPIRLYSKAEITIFTLTPQPSP